MAKGNMFQGMARGKVGDVVFSRLNGQQISRVRNRAPHNPRSEKQLTQRIIMNTVMQAYSKMSAIVDHSFEGYKAGQETMSQFMSLNAKALRTKVANAVANNDDLASLYAFTPLGSSYYSPNDFILSKGTLPEVVPSTGVGSTVSTLQLEFSDTSLTYQTVIDAYGLKRGDQITFVCMYASPSNSEDGEFIYTRVILDPTSADGTPAPLSSNLIDSVNGKINVPSPRNEGTFRSLSVGMGTSSVTLEYTLSNKILISAAVILSSKKADGTWARSNSKFITFNLGAFAQGYLSFAEALDRAMYGDIDFLSDRYLNNAGTGNLPNTSTEIIPSVGTGAATGVYVIGRSIPVYMSGSGSSITPIVVGQDLVLANASSSFIPSVIAEGWSINVIGQGNLAVTDYTLADLFKQAFDNKINPTPPERP